ncbi:hypothetical protein FB2170_11491 [Maribacter sp. HTCC2170]|nr:hypothetical protein FB2170_11491 [Maribacter sp. HTCC2170]
MIFDFLIDEYGSKLAAKVSVPSPLNPFCAFQRGKI